MPESQLLPQNLKKYQQAAIGFVILNMAYLVVAWWKVPSFDIPPAKAAGYLVFLIIFIGTLTRFIYRGSQKLVLVLAAIYAGRILFSSYTITLGIAHPMVPYVLPTTVTCFYLFGRTLWNWP